MKNFLMGCIGLLLGCGLNVMAADYPDSFQVEVSPSNFEVNQFVDLKISAIKNGKIMKGYEGSFMITVEEDDKYLPQHAVVLPDGGRGTLKLTDQGVKVYSKGVSIKKPGTFSLKVEDMIQETIVGSTIIHVHSSEQADLTPIELLSPLQNGQETSSKMNVMANIPGLENSRIQIYLNDLMVKEGMTDANGLFNETVDLKTPGTNVIELKAFSINNQIVGISEKRTFLYSPLSDDLLKEFKMTPQKDIKLGDKVRFELLTQDRVSSAKIIFSGDTISVEYPLDKEKDGVFSKEITMQKTGDIILSSQLIAGDMNKKYENMGTFFVKDHLKIGEVKIQQSKNSLGTINLSWTTIGGKSDNYAVKYGLSKDKLDGVVFTTEENIAVDGFTYGKRYFFQIMATDNNHTPEGLPSDVIEFELSIAGGTGTIANPLLENKLSIEEDHPVADVVDSPMCVVKNIQVSTKKIGNKYYLVWKNIDNIKKYLVYKSDFSDGSNRIFVGETMVPRFEYPFDRNSEKDIYAYYTIEAVCSDGEKRVLAQAERVKVGPLEDMMIILIATFLMYLMYRLYTYRI